ncbi:hypothetical protein [Streptomyces profundus]|uniref:hypothetical protein n=1 Tax=Streptomyces profundus TaxID=2867410 RepID=UPI001D16560E|nr:hypothetical protein [Streptomyces sp. MA3_2.13]UED87015.1 hypothetical protein K4G22_24765 [Streptomyces sp. MA3_2.13]
MVEARVKNTDEPAPEPGSGGDGPRRPRIELTWAQVVASAAATVTGALLASGLGVYGTVIGAGLISVVATAGGPVYQHALDRRGARSVPAPPTPVAEPPRPPGRRARLRRRLAVAFGVFALAMATITGIELAAGSSFAGWWGEERGGGTSVGELFGRDERDARPGEGEPGPAETGTEQRQEEESEAPDGREERQDGPADPETAPTPPEPTGPADPETPGTPTDPSTPESDPTAPEPTEPTEPAESTAPAPTGDGAAEPPTG